MNVERGTRLGPYEVLGPLGRGGMGEVWEARDARLGRTVALKVLPAELAGDPERLARLLSEARLASSLNHPNLVTVFDVGNDAGVAWLAMERVAGATLRELLAKGALPIRQALPLAAQVADGLARAHAAGIVHRDLKPENVMVADDGHVTVLDFGLAKRSAPSDRTDLPTAPLLTARGQVVGTLAYMAPEQLTDRPADFRTDQFALGVVLHEMLAGRRPFGGASPTEIAAAILRDDPAPLPDGIPAPVRWVVERCLARDPAGRYAATDDLARDLRTLRDRLGEAAAVPAAVPARPRRVAIGVAAAAGLLAGLLLLAVPGVRARLAPGPARSGGLHATQLTPGGREYDAVLSPDGRTFAYRSEEGDTPDLWVRQVSGGDPVRLTHDEAVEEDVAWAPDGESLYYVTEGGGDPVIWRIGALGGTPRKIAAGARCPAPSPDGRHLAWLRKKGDADPFAIEIANADGSDPKRVLEADGIAFAAFSPDGRTIAFSDGSLFAAKPLRLLDVASGRVRTATGPSSGNVFGAAWLPDGKRLVASLGADRFPLATGLDLAIVPADGSGGIETLLPNVGTRFVGPSVSRDGRRLLVSMERMQSELWKAPLDGTPEENGARARLLLGASWNPFWTHVSRDGRTVLFGSKAKGAWNLFTMPVDASAPPRQVTFLAGNQVLHSSLSPDGKRVAYASQQDGPAQIWVADVDGAGARKLTRDAGPDYWPIWSRDGTWIYYSSKAGGPTYRAFRVPASRGAAEPVAPSEWLLRGDASPVDDRLAYWSDNTVVLLDGRGEVLRKLPPSPAMEWTLPVFSPDGRVLSILRRERYGNRAVYSVDAATGEERPLVRFPGKFEPVFRAAWADGGRSIVVNRVDYPSNVVLVEGF